MLKSFFLTLSEVSIWLARVAMSLFTLIALGIALRSEDNPVEQEASDAGQAKT